MGLFILVNSRTIYTGEQWGHLHWEAGAIYVGPFIQVSNGAVYTGELGLFTLVSSGAVYTGELGLFTLVSSGAVYTGEDVCADPGLYTRLSDWDRCQPRSALFCIMPEHSSHLFYRAPSDLILQVQQLWKQVICKTCPVCVEQ